MYKSEEKRLLKKETWGTFVYKRRASRLVVKNLPASAGGCKRPGFNPGAGKTPWRRAWQPAPVFLPGESHRWRSLAGCSP